MGIFQPDLIHYTAIEEALRDMRKNRFLCEDAMSCILTDPFLKNLYGEKEIENFKKFLDKEIFIANAHRMPDTAKFPSITIVCGSGQEDSARDALGDGYDSELIDPSSLGGAFRATNVVAGPLTPISFDSDTGEIELPSSVDLSKIDEGMYVFDEINKTSYQIQAVMNDVILIEDTVRPNLNGMTIRSNRKNYNHTKKYMWHYETDTIVLESSDSTELFYLFTLVMYMILRYKQPLWDSRGFAVSTITYSGITRSTSADDPNIVFQREINIRGRVEHSVIESTDKLVTTNSGLKIADMKSPDVILEEVNKQGWKGELDE